MNQNYKELQEIAHRIALGVAIGTTHVIIPEEQPQTQTAQNLNRDCKKPMSLAVMTAELEKEKTQYEMRWMYDPTQKLYIAKYVKVEKEENDMKFRKKPVVIEAL